MAGMNPRAAATQSRTDETASRDALAVMAAVVVLAVTALIVVVGLFLTWYRPPRAASLTVDDATFTAAQVQHRLLDMMFNERAALGSDQNQFVSKTLDRIERDEVVLRRANTVVGNVDADAVTKHLRDLLAPPAPPVPVIKTDPGRTVTIPAATPVALSDEAYAKALQNRLKNAEMTKDELDPIARADLLQKQLRAKFREGLSISGPQVQMIVARLTDKAKADQVRAIGLRPGVDFVQIANYNSASGDAVGDPRWVLPEDLKQSVRDAVGPLKPGELSAVTPNGIYFEVYKVVATDASREFETAQLDTLVGQKFDAWVAAERAHVRLERVLSTDTEDWIRGGALAKFRARNAQHGG